jgi:hypothetical protein
LIKLLENLEVNFQLLIFSFDKVIGWSLDLIPRIEDIQKLELEGRDFSDLDRGSKFEEILHSAL